MDISLVRGAREEAFAIRTKVFVEEQGYQDEFDDIDARAVHIAAFVDGTAVGCARCFSDPEESRRFAIGRVAVLPAYREHGVGRMLVEACEEAIGERGAESIRLHAQARLEGWYASMGYARIGDVDYEDEGQPHVWMGKELVASQPS